MIRTALRWTGIAVAGVVVLTALAIAALYIPGVPGMIAAKVLPAIERSTGMRIEADDINLDFPLTLRVDRAVVMTAPADTMAAAHHLTVELRALPLLAGDIAIGRAEARDGFYRMGGRDSMLLRAEAEAIDIADARMNFGFTDIDVGDAQLTGGRVTLIFGDSIPSKTDTASTASAPMTIRARDVRLREVDFMMKMLPVIDSLAARIGDARLLDAEVDMARALITARSLRADSLTAAYFTPTAEYLATHPADTTATAAEPTATGLPWTVKADKITLTAQSATYAVAGAGPRPGFDPDYIQATDIDIEVDSFINRGMEIRVPLRRLTARERCGVRLDASGLFAMDSAAMRAEGFNVATLHSSLTFDAVMGLDSAPAETPVTVSARALVGLPDLEAAFPLLKHTLSAAPRRTALELRAEASGTMSRIRIDELSAGMQRVFSARAAGFIGNWSDPGNLTAGLDITGSIHDPGVAKPALADLRRSGLDVNLPPLALKARVDAKGGNWSGDLRATTGSGRIALKGRYGGSAPDYAATFAADSFPVRAFLPGLGIGTVTAEASATGHGYDIYDPATEIDIEATVSRLTYLGREYGGLTLTAATRGGTVRADLTSADRAARLRATADARISARRIDWKADARIDHLDLRALGLADTTMQGRAVIATTGSYLADSIGAEIRISDLDWALGVASLKAPGLTATIDAGPDSVAAGLRSRQLDAAFSAAAPLDSLLAGISNASAELDRQMTRRNFAADSISRLLPPLRLTVNSGPDNIINDWLRGSDMSFNTLALTAHNDSMLGMRAKVTRFTSGKTLAVDTIGIGIRQRGRYLLMASRISNRPGTMDEFAHVMLRAGLDGNKIAAHIKQENIKGENGYSIGLTLTAEPDSSMMVNIMPYTPIIAYRHWTVNPDNYIRFNPTTRRIGAKLDMAGGDSRVQLLAEESDSLDAPQQIRLKASDIKLADWISLNPFAPAIDGVTSADMNVTLTGGALTGTGTIGVSDLTYGRERVGSFDLAVDLTTGKHGFVNAEMALMVDSIKTITAIGTVNDSTKTSPFDLDFSMIRLPLRIANPFLPKEMAQMSGTLNGTMKITGTPAAPVFNGFLQFDSAAVDIGMLGTSLKFSDRAIPMDSNVVRFDRYAVNCVNENPLTVDGTVDLGNIAAPVLDLTLQARNTQLTGGKKRRRADVYGNSYIDLDATARGDMSRFIDVNAELTVLRATDVTYILGDAATAQLGSADTGEMVRFVNFADTVATADTDTIEPPRGLALNVKALLAVQAGATINVDLSNDASNRVQIQPEGSLDYSLSPFGQSRLTGRLTINDGFVRYSPPLISEKNFTFTPGSYVAFNGDMLNPNLDIKAVEHIKSNVSRPGENSRLVDFDITASVTGTLERMNVTFDLTSRGDITVQNELQSMSPDQRANQAMNMLLYNVYTGPGTTTSGPGLSGNVLYSFLASQINSWAANNIRGVELSFGIDQYDRTYQGSTSTTTSYSYKVSKSLFNNRFKIVVGGNYSTDADADENFAENLISDISFEYMLTKSGSVYVRLFRHTGFESILEGEITQTGAGFVYKHKLHRLSDMFNFLRPRRKTVITNE